jgi:hypothetical protein
MADKNILEQMLGHLVNDDKQKAEELFHEYVVAKSREIYEQLIEAEMDDEEEKEEEVDEASEEEKEEGEDDLDENFEDIAYEGDDEEGGFGGDATDDLAGEMGPEEGDEFADKDPEELFQDLDSIVDELQAKFDAMNGDDMGGDDMGGMGDDEKMKDGFDLATVREYVEKVPAGHGAEKKGQGEKADGSAGGLKFSKNDMGGTSANILGGKNGSDAGMQGMSGDLKGSGLSKGKPQLQDGGNVNTPGAKNGNAFSTKEPGHGAEKAGSKESADKGAAGLFRGRR